MAPIASSVDCVGHIEHDADCKSDARAAGQHHEVNSGNATHVRTAYKARYSLARTIFLWSAVKWVTREYVHVDRTACPWLIRRFVDPEAEFAFISLEKIEEFVRREKAIPYDTPGTELGHHGDKCSFDAIVRQHRLEDPAVLELAKIVRAADTGKPEMAPEAAGLDAAMTGISIEAKDDHEAIERASPVYDAFYAFCKLKLLRRKYKARIEKMDRDKRRKFLKEKLLE